MEHMQEVQGYTKVMELLLLLEIHISIVWTRSRGRDSTLGTIYKELFKIHFPNLKCINNTKIPFPSNPTGTEERKVNQEKVRMNNHIQPWLVWFSRTKVLLV